MVFLAGVFLFAAFFTVFGEEDVIQDKIIVSARVESCAGSGCQLNRLFEVKKFIYYDLPFFHDVSFKNVPRAPPVMLFLNKEEQTLESVDLSEKTRQECNDLLLSRGFYKKVSPAEEVPDDVSGPYKGNDDL